MRLSDLQTKMVVNVSDGRHLGVISDAEVSDTGNINYFTVDNDSFKYENDLLYKNNTIISSDEYNYILKFNHKNIYTLLNNSTLDKKVTYSDLSEKQTYIISSSYFYNWYNNTLETSNNVIIDVTINNNVVSKIEINSIDLNVNITYDHINEIKQIEGGLNG